MAKKGIRSVKGMRDLLPDQTPWWQWLEARFAGVLDRYGYAEIRTPMLESTSLFARSIGQETDIVSKEMYTFIDRDEASLTLRPEGTAAVVRAFVEHNLARRSPVNRLFYQGPMFRRERTQRGRFRQFCQMGAELIGVAEPAADVELIDLMTECMAAVGLADTTLELNSLGCDTCRPPYREALVAYFDGQREDLCEDCQRRLKTNPLRVLDCKQTACVTLAEKAPHMIEQLCGDCSEHFTAVRSGLEGLAIEYRLNHRMVRGLDYYNRTTFELTARGLGAQNAVAAGGRYDGLIKQMGGQATPAIGFAAGLDRILLKLAESAPAPAGPPVTFVVTWGEPAYAGSLGMVQQLRREGFKVLTDVRLGSMKSQMKRADKEGARFVLVIGDDEMKTGSVTVKDMAADSESSEKQVTVPREEVPDLLRKRLGSGATSGELEAT